MKQQKVSFRGMPCYLLVESSLKRNRNLIKLNYYVRITCC